MSPADLQPTPSAAERAQPADTAATSQRTWPKLLLRVACQLVAWSVVLALAAAIWCRLYHHDASYFLVWVNAFTLYVYLPAYFVLAWAAWQRQWLLSAAGLALVGFHLAWVLPDFAPAAKLTAPLDTTAVGYSAPLRIFYANVHSQNEHHEELLHEIAEADPDVIVLVEFSGIWQQAFERAPVIAAYEHRLPPTTIHSPAIGVYSKLPLENAKSRWVARTLAAELDVRLGDQSLHLFCLHAQRPMNLEWHDYFGFWDAMAPVLAELPEPVVVVGDFNATQHSEAFQRVTSGRLRGAHEDRGRGYATTWPNGQWRLPPIRIDHALLSPGVECLVIREGQGVGSDHRPLVVDVRLRPNP